MYFVLKVIVGMEAKKNISLAHSKYIIVSNHSSHTDTSAIFSLLPFSQIHRVRPVAAGDYFSSTKLTHILSRLFYNVLLIDRVSKEGKHESVKQMIDSLDSGSSLLIYPEGSRVKENTVGDFKTGIAKILKARPNIPYIPIYIGSSAQTLPKGDGLVLPHNFNISVGELSYIDKDKSEEEIINSIREEVLNLI